MNDFGELITKTLRGAGIRKSELVKALEIHPSTLSRALSGGISKPLALAIIFTVNRLAGSQILDEQKALELLNFSPIGSRKEFGLGSGLTLSADASLPETEISRIVEDIKLTLEFRRRAAKA